MFGILVESFGSLYFFTRNKFEKLSFEVFRIVFSIGAAINIVKVILCYIIIDFTIFHLNRDNFE